MSWHANDLVADADLRDYESAILSGFGASSWMARRTKALEDWLFPILKSRGFNPYRLRTRAEPSKAWGYTGSAYTDVTAACSSLTDDDVNLATVFATPGTDALYLGSVRPFRGLVVRMADTVSSASSVLSVAYWNGNWEGVLVDDKTSQVSGKTFSAGGTITWLLPSDWETRKVNGSDALYWARVTVSSVPTGALAGQVGVIWGSALRAPATFRTLELIFREAPASQEGPWADKAAFYHDEADLALQRALLIVGGEFDTDENELINTTEAAQTPAEAGGGPWRLERA